MKGTTLRQEQEHGTNQDGWKRKPSRWHVAIQAIRPKTLAAAVAPVWMGTALAWADGKFHAWSAFLCLWGALLIQIGTNVANDYFDFIKGADQAKRQGPVRVTQAGWVEPQTMWWAFVLVFVVAFLSGIPLVWRGGWPIVWIGLLSIASGIGYTRGAYALAYTGWADIFALIFFGPVAVGATYYLQALTISPVVVLWGLAPGLIAMGLLTVNNLRDIDTDREVNKKTLAVRWGETFARTEYIVCMLGAAIIPAVVFFVFRPSWFVLMPSLFLLFALPIIRSVLMTREGAVMNRALARTGQLLLLYSALFSVGWLL